MRLRLLNFWFLETIYILEEIVMPNSKLLAKHNHSNLNFRTFVSPGTFPSNVTFFKNYFVRDLNLTSEIHLNFQVSIA